MDASIIRHSLDLAVNLNDTTNGYVVEERNVRFWMNGKAVQPVSRGSGNHVFLDRGREDCELEIQVNGYEPCRLKIRYEELDKLIPTKAVFLIPSENNGKGQPLLSLTGRLQGLEKLQAVSFSSTGCCINSFDERKCIMSLFKSYRYSMEGIYYGLLNMERQTYEPFVVTEELTALSVKLASPLREPFSVNSPIARTVFGCVDEDGSYCLRVRDDSDYLNYLVRYVVNGEVRFKKVDFHKLDAAALE